MDSAMPTFGHLQSSAGQGPEQPDLTLKYFTNVLHFLSTSEKKNRLTVILLKNNTTNNAVPEKPVLRHAI